MKKDLSTIKLAFRNNLIICVVKTIVAIITGSAGLIAEAVHSGADSVNQLVLLRGVKKSGIAACEKFNFGHGKQEYIHCMRVGEFLFVGGGVWSIFEGIHKILNPEPIQYVSLGVIVLLIGFALELQSWIKARVELGNPAFSDMIEKLRDSKDGNTVVVFTEDTGAILGLFTALLGTLGSWITGDPLYDAMASVIIGIELVIMAWFLGNEMNALLIGESIDPIKARQVRRVINRHQLVKKVGTIRTEQLGSDCCKICVDVDFEDDLHDYELEKIMVDLKKEIRDTLPEAKYIYIQLQKV